VSPRKTGTEDINDRLDALDDEITELVEQIAAARAMTAVDRARAARRLAAEARVVFGRWGDGAVVEATRELGWDGAAAALGHTSTASVAKAVRRFNGRTVPKGNPTRP
jgi:chemotaxis regulatin CheY-phosphate phosphatase CheZ